MSSMFAAHAVQLHYALHSPRATRGQCARGCARRPKSSKSRYKICIHEIFCAGSFLPMRLRVLVLEFVRYSAIFLRTIDGGSYSRFMRKTRSI
jgi:hypothetical protein